MSFESLINLRNCRVTRNTDVLLEKTQILAGPVITRQPPRAACLAIEISGCFDGTGEVIVNGTVEDAGDQEIFIFSQNEIVEGEKEFTEITSISTVDLITEVVIGDLEIKAMTPTGQEILQEIEIFTEMNCWIDYRRGGVVVQIPGGIITSVTKLFCKLNPLQPVLENDLIYYRDRKYRVDAVEEVMSRSLTPHHLELILKQAKINED